MRCYETFLSLVLT